MPDPSVAERTRATTLAEEHGYNAVSLQGVREGFLYLFHGDGYVPYVDTGAAWIAAGPPVCHADALADTVQAFVARAGEAGRRVCLFGVEPRLLAALAGSLDEILIGEQPVWDPRAWTQALKNRPSLKEQLRRARAKGVTIDTLSDSADDELRADLDQLTSRWLAARAMPPMGFLVRPPRASELDAERPLFVARQGEQLVGAALLVPVPGRRGWLVEHLIRHPQAPNGTVELLIDAVMRWAGEAGCSWLSLGLAPLAGEVSGPLRLARRKMRWLYDFEGLLRFKAKLEPVAWIPIHLVFPRTQGQAASLLDVLTAFATGSILRFALRFITRGHPAVLWLLAALLVPWTATLAWAPVHEWFSGHEAVKWAWVTFDALLCIGLARLIRRPSWQLAALLAAAVQLDALLTPVEIVAWNLPGGTGGMKIVVLLAALIAPALASVALWGATIRLRRLAGEPGRPGRASVPVLP